MFLKICSTWKLFHDKKHFGFFFLLIAEIKAEQRTQIKWNL